MKIRIQIDISTKNGKALYTVRRFKMRSKRWRDTHEIRHVTNMELGIGELEALFETSGSDS